MISDEARRIARWGPWQQCYPNGESPAIGRLAALWAGLPVEVPGFQVDRRCGSGLLAVCLAAMQIQTGVADLVLAGGVESMSNVEYYTLDMRWGRRHGHVQMYDRLDRGRVTAGCESRFLVEGGMLETAENLRRQYGIPREEQDMYALRSHRRVIAAWNEGKFQDYIARYLSKGQRVQNSSSTGTSSPGLTRVLRPSAN